MNNGEPAYPARMAFGALLIKQMLGCPDRELCAQIAENPYLQYPIGLKEFQDNGCPFGALTVSSFRKRFSEEDLKRINERIVSGEGYARIDHVGFDPFHEAACLKVYIKRYRLRTGHYPKHVLVDKAYRNRENLSWCKERGIAISGPKLRRPPKDKAITREQKAQEHADTCARNAAEGLFGTTKTAYGLPRVAARLEETTRTVICMAVLVFNLKKMLRATLSAFLGWLQLRVVAVYR